MRKTGGGEKTEEKLNGIEEEIVEMICPTLIAGHEEVAESLVVPLEVNKIFVSYNTAMNSLL